MQKSKKNKKIKKLFSTFGLTEDKEFFIENLSMLLGSGMAILPAISSIKEEVKSPRMRRIIEFIQKEVMAGSSLWQALKKTGIFSNYVVSLIKTGETAGKLSNNLKVITTRQQKERILKTKIQTALLYPSIVISLTFVIGIGIIWFILPRLSKVFSQLKIEMPLITKIFIGIGDFFGQYGFIVVPIIIITIILFMFFAFINPKTKFIGQYLMFQLPGIRRFIQEVELVRMGYILGTLINSGVSILNAIDSLIYTTDFYNYKKLYQFLKKNIENGNSFKKSFAKYPNLGQLINAPIQQMIIASEQSGHFADTMIKIGEMYEAKNDNTSKRLTVLIEPILLVIIWVGVVTVALAVILPIYSLVGNFNQNRTAPPNRPAQVEQGNQVETKRIEAVTGGENVPPSQADLEKIEEIKAKNNEN
jgi:type IV pilus assembly protein PilC